MVARSDPGRIVIAGGSGGLGRSLARMLVERGDAVTILSRSSPVDGPWRHARWDGRTVGEWASELDGARAVVNLAGRSVDCVKTASHKDEILRSRVESTLAIGRALGAMSNPPPVWVQMSTAHVYGDPPEAVCDEDTPFGVGLAPEVARAWEAACIETCPDHVRRVVMRTSFVLAREGGAMSRLRALARIGLGGTIGNGHQGMSWIHELDMNRLFVRAIEDETMAGAYIATAPNPVSNRIFMRALRQAMGVPFGLPAPRIMVPIGAALMRTDPELALYGRFCVSRRLSEDGFEFKFPEIDEAMQDLFSRA